MTFVTHDGPYIFNGPQDRIPPGGTLSGWVDGSAPPPYDDCTITVTAQGLTGLVSGPQFLEISIPRRWVNSTERRTASLYQAESPCSCISRTRCPSRCP
jgi:hypothetical protein